MDKSSGQGGDLVRVSAAMRDAGEAVLDELSDSYPPSLLVEAVYIAMRAVETDQAAFPYSAPASGLSHKGLAASKGGKASIGRQKRH